MINLYAFTTEQEARENIKRLQSDSKKLRPKDQLFHEVYLPFACSNNKGKEWFGYVDNSGLTAVIGANSLDRLIESFYRMTCLKGLQGHGEVSHVYTFRDNVKKPPVVIGRYLWLTLKYGKILRHLTEQEMEEFQQGYLRMEKNKP